MARLADTSWGNRVSVAGTNFKSATQHEIAVVQEDLSNNSLVALIFLTFINGVIEFLVIYYGVDTWFIIGVMVFIFFSTIMLSLISTIYFLGKHVSGSTFWQKFGCCTCCGRVKRIKYVLLKSKRKPF
jgi:hypothetical protein